MNAVADKYQVWQPRPDLPLLDFVSLIDDREGFRVITTPSHTPYEVTSLITFQFRRAFAYRNIDEAKRLRTLNALSEQGILHASSLYTVEPSSWLEWFFAENFEMPNLVHYAIYTSDDMIDVIAWPEEVTVTIVENAPNKTDAGNGSNGICRVSDASRSPSPDPRR
jgi:hypothetical protein|uniref:hypothetical protein n=1 Tax=Prosthecobacter sp. TaxID=1965333 RepID=UPI00378496B7